MHLFSKLWDDSTGFLMSAEAAIVGTIAVVGVTTGLSVVAKSVNEELQDMAFAIRSLDQSYCIAAQESCGAKTAGSSFTQQPVEKSLDALNQYVEEVEKQERSQAERLEQKVKDKRKSHDDDDARSDRRKRRDRSL